MRLHNSGIDGAVWYEAGGKSEKAESTISLCRTVYPSGCEALLKVISKLASSSTTSSYTFVSPSDLCSDDERWTARRTQLLVVWPTRNTCWQLPFFLPTQATLHNLASEDKDTPIPIPIHGLGGGWSESQEPAKIAWRQASQGSSPELLPISNGFDSQPNYPPVSHFLKRELLQIRPVVGGYIAFWAMEM